MNRTVLVLPVKLLAMWGLQGWPWWEEVRAALCQTPAVPSSSKRSTAGHSWALSQNGGALEKTQLWKSKQCQTGRRAGNRKSGKQQREHQGQRRKSSTLWSRYSTAAYGGPTPKQEGLEGLWPVENLQCSGFFPEGLQPLGEPMQEQVKSVRRKEGQREAVMYWPQPPIPHLPLHCSGAGERSLEWGSEVGPAKWGRKGVGLMFVFLFLITCIYFNW